jgi:hypothetical protein
MVGEVSAERPEHEQMFAEVPDDTADTALGVTLPRVAMPAP